MKSELKSGFANLNISVYVLKVLLNRGIFKKIWLLSMPSLATILKFLWRWFFNSGLTEIHFMEIKMRAKKAIQA